MNDRRRPTTVTVCCDQKYVWRVASTHVTVLCQFTDLTTLMCSMICSLVLGTSRHVSSTQYNLVNCCHKIHTKIRIITCCWVQAEESSSLRDDVKSIVWHTLVVSTQTFRTKTLSSRTKTRQSINHEAQLHNWLVEKSHDSRNRVMCSHEIDDLLIKYNWSVVTIQWFNNQHTTKIGKQRFMLTATYKCSSSFTNAMTKNDQKTKTLKTCLNTKNHNC